MFSSILVMASQDAIAGETVRKISNLPVGVSSPAIADLNEDGFNDIIFVACNGGDCFRVGSTTDLPALAGGDEKGFETLDAPPVPRLHQPNGPITLFDISTPPGAGRESMYVHVLDGSTDYQEELSGFPQIITAGGVFPDPTVAIADVNFDGSLDVLVGGGVSDVFAYRTVFAFRVDGSSVPGWEAVTSCAPPFFNAFAVGDVNADGAIDTVAADESTYIHRYGALGHFRQDQFVDDPIFSSPAIGDLVDRFGNRRADGIPDELSNGAGINYIRIFDSFGEARACIDFIQPDLRWSTDYRSGGQYKSSPALADLDGDGTQDIVIQWGFRLELGAPETGQLEVFSSRYGTLDIFRFPGHRNEIVTDILGSGYSSPAIVDLDGDGQALEVLIGTVSGHVYALRYDQEHARIRPPLQLIWERKLEPYSELRGAVTSSVIAADLDDDGRPEIVAATEAGNVFLLNPDGEILRTFSCLNGNRWLPDAAIWSTPSVGLTRRVPNLPIPENESPRPMIVVANRRGVFQIVLDEYPSYSEQNQAWPTFHGNNARTGSLDFPVFPIFGSIGGTLACPSAGRFVTLLDADGSRVEDYYTEMPAQATTVSDGRFLFEMLRPGNYQLQFEGLDESTRTSVVVLPGEMSFVNGPLYHRSDWDLNGRLDSADFFSFLNSFFAGAADLNDDGFTDSQDFFQFLESFFAGPCSDS